MALVNKRIIDLPERSALNNDDYTVVDGDTGGTAKYNLANMNDSIDEVRQSVTALSGTVTAQGQQLATTNQNVAQNTEDITDLKEDLSDTVDLYTTVPATDTVLFTTDDVNVGDKITYKIVMPNISSSGSHTGYIGLYDAQNNRLAYYGRGSSSDPTTVFEGTFDIPSGFSYSKWYGAKTPTSLYAGKFVKFKPHGVVRFDENQILTDEQKGTVQRNIGIEDYAEIQNFLEGAMEGASGDVDISDYPEHTGWLTGSNTWTIFYNTESHCIIPVEVGEEITIKTNVDRGIYMALFSDYITPVNNASAPVVSGWGRQYIQPNTTETFTVPAGTVYLYLGLYNGEGARYSLKSLTIPSAATGSTLIEVIDDVLYNDGIASVSLASPTSILSNKDASATSFDNGWLEYFNIIQMSESMYYMYYCATGASAGGGDYNGNLLFAYSTDGTTYTRGFPQGITPPFPGTNKVFTGNNPDNIAEQSVFKCCDPVYPFRLICQQKHGTNDNYINMYKSEDGINFDASTMRTLRKEFHDNQICVIPRGDVIKIYFRENASRVVNGVSHRSREISVMFFDLDGNLLSPKKDLPLQFVYDSAATMINDTEEIIFPTNFDNTEVGGVASQAFSVDVYRVAKYHVTPVQSNLDDYFGTNDKFVVFAPGFITINNEQYIAFKTQNINHDDYASSDPSTRTSTYKLAKITLAF